MDDFEKRCRTRREQALKAHKGETYRRVSCGEHYTYAWVYEYGPVCHCECNGMLEKEVTHE